jgi:Fe-Mn family superoxide dismutase
MHYTPYTEKTFTFPTMAGLSEKQISEHFKLYQGYVKNTNLMLATLEELKKDSDKNALALSEILRRFSFEWNGMRLHELYFESLGGNGVLDENISLFKKINAQYGSFEMWLAECKAIALMRGIGWVLLSYDKANDLLLTRWVSDHEVGHLGSLPIILALDVWEHAYLVDYPPSGRKDYLEAFFKNLNWQISNIRLEHASL